MLHRFLKTCLLGVGLLAFTLFAAEALSRGTVGAGGRPIGGSGFRGGGLPSSPGGTPHPVPHTPIGGHPGFGGPSTPHGGFPAGHPGFGPGGLYGSHEGMLHTAGPHWNGYHQAYIGNHPVHLAWAGYRPSYYYHPWYHGPWYGFSFGWGWGFGPGVAFGIAGAGWGLSFGTVLPYGPYGYWGYPLGWGYGGWGLGTVVYTSGYYPYYNPYYSPVFYPTIVYDYSRPIPVIIQPPPGTSPTSNEPIDVPQDPAFDAARNAFRAGDYRAALIDVDRAISRNPGDAVFHEFRALVLFARRDYRQAAATLHSLLAVGPGWDWTTMSGLYADPEIYSGQLRELEMYSRANPQAADAHFVLGYHYMILGHKDSAVVQLQRVVALQPNDRLADELLRMVKGPPRQSAPIGLDDQPVPNPPTDGLTNSTPDSIDKGRLPGTWRAARPDGSKFVLVLTEEGTFHWKYTTPSQTGDQFGGTYAVDGPVLILQRKEGGALSGTLEFSDDDDFLFKLVGAPPDDKGLSFAR